MSRGIWCAVSMFMAFFTAIAEGPQIGTSPFTVVVDTGVSSLSSLSTEAFAQADGWRALEYDSPEHTFAGDAIVANDRLAAVIRTNAAGVELYAIGAEGPVLRSVLELVASGTSRTPQHVAMVQYGEDAAVIDIRRGDTAEGLRLELPMGKPHVKVQTLDFTSTLRVVTPCRFAVMPDFFADDIVLDATAIPPDRVEQPSENLFMQMAGDGDAIIMSVWENRDQDIAVNLSGVGDERRMDSAEIAFGADAAVWIAVLDEQAIWHQRPISEDDLGVELPLTWKPPYPATWRVDWHRADGLSDSWEMIAEQVDGTFSKPEPFESIPEDWVGQDWWVTGSPRERWNTVLGKYWYPAWFDKDGNAYLQPLKEVYNWSTNPEGSYHPLPKESRWVGPAVIYPVDRGIDTPLDRYSITDIVRTTLGVGPCQYILDVEGQKQQFRGRPTCDVRDILNEIYENEEQIAKQADVEQAVNDVIVFVKLIRSRIEAYREFGQDMDAYLASCEAANPELSGFIASMREANGGIARAIANREEGIQSIFYAEGLAAQFRDEVLGHNGEDALKRCKTITRSWVHMGDNQDELVAECRVAVKVLRQRAFMASLTEPAATDIAREIRERTQAVLRSPVSYEGARH